MSVAVCQHFHNPWNGSVDFEQTSQNWFADGSPYKVSHFISFSYISGSKALYLLCNMI